jgi:membrane protein implicated in regulation of membrane protease activity
MSLWVAWLIAAGVLAVGEILTLAMFAGPLALGALLAAGGAAAGLGIAGSLTIFIGGSIAGLLALRPIARRHLRLPPKTRTGVAALTGQPALVIDRVDNDGGTIKLAGEVWTAKSLEATRVFEPGDRVTVVEIAGATAIVME